MKSIIIKTLLFLVSLSVINNLIFAQTDSYRLLDPVYGGRYGKTPYAGPPFYHYTTTGYQYYINASNYNNFLSDVSNSFGQWSQSGYVGYSSGSSGLQLTTFTDYSRSGGIMNPGVTSVSANGSYEIQPSNSYVALNTAHTWSSYDQNLRIDYFDVQSILVHEIGHMMGIAHPATNTYTHDATAPVMAGADNQYFWSSLDGRTIKWQDAYAMVFLQTYVPNIMPTLNNATSTTQNLGIGYIYLTNNYTETNNISIPSGSILTINSGITVTLSNSRIKVTGGSFVDNGATWLPYDLKIMEGSILKGHYSTLSDAINNLNSGETLFISSGSHTLSQAVTLASGCALQLNSGVSIAFNGGFTVNGNLTTNGATLTFGSGTVSSINGYMSSNNTTLTFGSGSTCYVTGRIDGAYSTTFQGNGTAGSWNGIVVQNNSGALIQQCVIKDADRGVRQYNANANIWSNYIQNCNRGMEFQNGSGGNRQRWNRFIGNPYDVWGDANSTPLFGTSSYIGENSFRENGTAIYNIWSTNTATIEAIGNYFQAGPAVGPNISILPTLAVDPNPVIKTFIPERPKNETAILSKLSNMKTEKEPGLDEFNKAFGLYASEKYDDSKIALNEIIDKFPESSLAKQAIILIEKINEPADKVSENPVIRVYKNKSLTDFADYRKTYRYIKMGLYKEAFEHANSSSVEKSNLEMEPYKLYDLAMIKYYYMDKKEESKQYFSELISKYPDHDLTVSAKLYLGLNQNINPPQADNLSVNGVTQLMANYPNPFNPTTVIKYTLGENQNITIKIFDALGREVKTLVNGYKQAGSYEVKFDGSGLSSGLYFYQLKAGAKTQIMKMMMAK